MTNEQIDKAVEESLNQRMEEVAKEISQPLSVRREQQVIDFDKLIGIVSRLLKQKVDEHMLEPSSYERIRTELMNSYRVRMESLKIEAEEQLRSLDRQHNEKMQALEKLINKLKALREA